MPNNPGHNDRGALIRELFKQSVATKQATLQSAGPHIVSAADMLIRALDSGHTILSCGNGGSAGDAQHFSSELVNRFEHNRRALPAIALTTESSTLTAIGNDYGYDRLFSRQVEALGRPGDILLAFSTSGNSTNVIAAVDVAHQNGLSVVALTGKDGGALTQVLDTSDVELRAVSNSTARVQEVHLLFIHCLCRLIEDHVCSGAADKIT